MGRRVSYNCVGLLSSAALTLVAATLLPDEAEAQEPHQSIELPAERVTAVMTEFDPFVTRRGDRPSGFYAEIWQTVALELGVDVDIVWVDSFAELLSTLDRGDADVAVAPLTPSADREPRYDFTSSIVSSGPQLGYHKRLETSGGLIDAMFSPAIQQLLIVATAGLLILAHLIWLVERGRDGGNDCADGNDRAGGNDCADGNDRADGDFSDSYLQGIWDGLWWAAVTVTTVGYGDKSPRSVGGRTVALLAMLLSLFLVGAFVSQVTSTLQENRQAPVTGLDDVDNRAVGVVEGSSFAAYVADQGIANVVDYPSQRALFEAAATGEVDLVVANPYALTTAGHRAGIVATGHTFYAEYETFAVTQGSPWREPINQVLAELQASGEIDQIVERWMTNADP